MYIYNIYIYIYTHHTNILKEYYIKLFINVYY